MFFIKKNKVGVSAEKIVGLIYPLFFQSCKDLSLSAKINFRNTDLFTSLFILSRTETFILNRFTGCAAFALDLINSEVSYEDN